jgi:hypothetical protein
MVKGICKLCRKEAALQNSHIIPEHFFRPLYDVTDNKHDALVITAEPYSEKFLRKGFYDRLLCQNCEQLRNRRYETYATELWKTRFPGSLTRGVFVIEPVDYARLKLFFLSVLWLAGESQRPEFNHVVLGPHADRLRDMIWNEDPGDDNEYTFYGMVMIRPDTNEPLDMIFNPVPLNNEEGYMFSFGGCKWFFFTSQQSSIPCCLQRPGSLYLAKAPIEEDSTIGHFMRSSNKYHGTAGYPARTEIQG